MFASPPTLTIGDEFQAVLNTADDLFLLIHRIEISLHPIQLRFGLGIGGIDTPINSEAAIGMDGSAFHRARRSLEIAKTQNLKYVLSVKDSDETDANRLLVSWINAAIQSWSTEKVKILVKRREGLKQKEIAAQLNISQPAVSQQINQNFFKLILTTERFLEETLNTLLLKG
ncbi:MAG: hypothetical protein GXO77_01335 [Calditrichaeota bacterium]|nr:hypothetical protein [Calditrichota bacterium]